MEPGTCRRLLLLALLGAALPAWAGCSRPINAPSAPNGLSVVLRGDTVGGVYPDLLNAIGEQVGCKFVWSSVPRARLEAMFENGTADLLMPATNSVRRDQLGTFVPMLETRPYLVSVIGKRSPVASMAHLLERRELRVALVRGFDYGPAYLDMSKKLGTQGRLILESSPANVLRLLRDGLADVAILTPIGVYGAIKTEPRIEDLDNRIRLEPLPEMPWIKSGVYLSNKSLNPADRATLEKGIAAAVRAGALIQAYKRTYPADMLHEGVRPVTTSP
jgi:polar amino acid transport system substrate-binding protein